MSNLMRSARLALTASVLSAAAVLPALSPASAQVTLRAAMHSDLKIIDPIWTTALISTHHGYMVYDTLFAFDAQLAVQPQMVDKYTLSDDRVTWTFTLRDGLAFHDGAPVTTDDVIASIKRWGARDSVGQKLLSFVAAMEVVDATGSGPFIFVKDQWKAGEKAVYVKNTKYVPRPEPASGLAGGKVAKVDRVEWLAMPDVQTQVNALLNGEIDLVEIVAVDLLPLLEKDKNIELKVVNTAGRQYAMRFNTLHKPFDNPKIRAAAMVALSAREFLDANVGDAKWFKECKSLFPCGTPLESTKGWDGVLNGDSAKARAMLAEAKYDGTPIVFLHQTDTPGHNNLATVGKAQLERAGFKIDLQAMDWQTLVSRRAKKEAPDKGGWGTYFTSWGAVDVLDPVAAAFLNAGCDKATFGWPCDPELEKLRDAYSKETDAAKQKAIAEQVQLRVLEYPTHVPLGQFTTPTALRRNISGLVQAPSFAFWNLEKK
jgi:peptide/nickel transport system substrate-binding protein